MIGGLVCSIIKHDLSIHLTCLLDLCLFVDANVCYFHFVCGFIRFVCLHESHVQFAICFAVMFFGTVCKVIFLKLSVQLRESIPFK